MKIINVSLTLVMLIQFQSCWAQSKEPTPSIELQRQEQQLQQLRKRNESFPDVRLQNIAEPVVARLPDEKPCMTIRAVQITGLALSSSESILAGPALDDAPENRCIGVQGIQVLIDRVQNVLVDQGYITSRVHALPQDLNSGMLVLNIDPGYIGQVRQVDSKTTMPSMVTSLATRSGAVLNLRDIEQTLENLRRNAGVEVDVRIIPGEIPGYSDIMIRYERNNPIHLNIAVDDSASKTTGKVQGSATVSWHNPLGLGDLAYLTAGQDLAQREPDPRGSQNYVLHYSVPIGYWLLSGTGSRNRYHQTVDGAFQSYLYSGESSSSEIQASYVVQRSASSKTSASVKAFARESGNYIDDTEVEVQHRRTGGWEIGLFHTKYLGLSTLDGQISYRRGTGAFNAMSAPEEAFGEGTSRMKITLASIALQSPFELGSAQLLYDGQLRMQWNHTPLTPQDRFCIGGRYTVRGFDGVQNLCGERGQLWRNEISAQIGSAGRVYGGLDIGRVAGDSTTQFSGRKLVGSVFGMRGAWQVWSNNAVYFDVFIGKPIVKPTEIGTTALATGFNLSTSF